MGITFLKLEVVQPCPRPPVPGLDQVLRDIDSQHVCAEFASGNAVVPSPQPRSSTLSPFVTPSRCTSAFAFAHGIGNAREIAFFPECFV
jgi:hypothetical protein